MKFSCKRHHLLLFFFFHFFSKEIEWNNVYLHMFIVLWPVRYAITMFLPRKHKTCAFCMHLQFIVCIWNNSYLPLNCCVCCVRCFMHKMLRFFIIRISDYHYFWCVCVCVFPFFHFKIFWFYHIRSSHTTQQRLSYSSVNFFWQICYYSLHLLDVDSFASVTVHTLYIVMHDMLHMCNIQPAVRSHPSACNELYLKFSS